MHPEVSRQLFGDGTKLITDNHDLLLDRGWRVLTASYPHLVIAVGHRSAGKVRVFRFACDNWNDLPPAMSLIDAETGQDLPGALWPTDNASHWHGSGWSPAPGVNTDKPFMCMVGIREYHTHQSHVGDSWDNYKNQPGFDLPGIVVKVTEVFQKSNV